MGFKVLIAESALADLKEIVEFVAQDDPAAASRNSPPVLGLVVVHHEAGVNDAGDPAKECQQET